MARVIEQSEWIALGLSGRKSSEIVSFRTGSRDATLRYVEIAVPVFGESQRGMHLHHGVEEIICVLEGNGTFQTPTERLTVHAGHVICVPAEEPHVTHNISDAPLRLMCFFSHPDVSSLTEEFKS